MTMKREPSISEQQAREIVERMGRRESRSEKSMDDFYRNIGLNPEQLAQPGKTVTKKAETATVGRHDIGTGGIQRGKGSPAPYPDDRLVDGVRSYSADDGPWRGCQWQPLACHRCNRRHDSGYIGIAVPRAVAVHHISIHSRTS